MRDLYRGHRQSVEPDRQHEPHQVLTSRPERATVSTAVCDRLHGLPFWRALANALIISLGLETDAR